MLRFIIVIGLLLLGTLVQAAPHAFPVPYVESQHPNGIFFTELQGAGVIKIYTVTGEEIAEIPVAAGEAPQKQWNPVVNKSGKKLATGVYLFRVEAGGSVTTGKLVVIR